MILLSSKDAKGNNTAFTEKVMFHVGSDYVDFTQKYHMVAFNLELMDAIWTEDDEKKSMLATWDNIFNYFATGFTVCKASSGTVSDMDHDCEYKVLDIEEGLRDTIKGNSFQNLTGCLYGYPDNVSIGSLAPLMKCPRLCLRAVMTVLLGVGRAATLRGSSNTVTSTTGLTLAQDPGPVFSS